MAARLSGGSLGCRAPPQVKGPFRDSSIVLRDLQPLSEYCLQVQAHLLWKSQDLSRLGRLSNVSCHVTSADGKVCLRCSF